MGLTGSHFVRVPGRRRAGNAPLLPAAHPFLGRARVSRRRVDGHAGRRAEAQGKALGAARRHPVAHVSLLRDAQALRGGRPAARGCAADALGDLGRDVQGAERVRRRDLEFPEPVHRRGDAPRRVPARPALCRAVRQARPRRRPAADRALRGARSPHGRHLPFGRRRTIRWRRSSARSRRRSPPNRSRPSSGPR